MEKLQKLKEILLINILNYIYIWICVIILIQNFELIKHIK